MNYSTLLRKVSLAGTGITLATIAMANSSEAVTISLSDSWYEFSFTDVDNNADGCFVDTGCVASPSGNSIFAPVEPWEFSAPSTGATLRVTDAFSRGDVFDIYDFDTLIGSTSLVDINPILPQTRDPEVAFADTTYSSGEFTLAPGEHSITIRPNISPFGLGAGYFQLYASPQVSQPTSVPEPISVLSLLALGSFGIVQMNSRVNSKK